MRNLNLFSIIVLLLHISLNCFVISFQTLNLQHDYSRSELSFNEHWITSNVICFQSASLQSYSVLKLTLHLLTHFFKYWWSNVFTVIENDWNHKKTKKLTQICLETKKSTLILLDHEFSCDTVNHSNSSLWNNIDLKFTIWTVNALTIL